MRDYVHEHFHKYPYETVRPHIRCADGTVYSVQASALHYSTPRSTGPGPFTTVEVWGPFTKEPEAQVRVDLVNRRIHRHGGLAEGEK